MKSLCNANGNYEASWTHTDGFEPSDIVDANHLYKLLGYSSPVAYLDDCFYKKVGDGLETQLVHQLERSVRDQTDTIQREWDTSDSIWDDLDEAGYKGLDLKTEELLGGTELRADLLLATRCETDHEMISIVTSFGNGSVATDLDNLTSGTLDNALSYLVNQQDYSLIDLYDALEGHGTASPFLQSVCAELKANESPYIAQVTVLIKTDAKSYLELMQRARNDEDGTILLPRDKASIGIYSRPVGCGGPIDIKLERDAVLPISMIQDSIIEDPASSNWGDNSIGVAYPSLDESKWQAGLTYRDDVAPAITEDYDLVLDAVTAGPEYDSIVSVESAARDAVDADRDGMESHEAIGEER